MTSFRGSDSMTPLERRYRRVLRLLPTDYRSAWEEDMVDTFLLTRLPEHTAAAGDNGYVDEHDANRDTDPSGDRDPDFDPDFDAEYGRPGWAEVASVVGLAVRLRLGGPGAPRRAFALGEVVRRVALVGLLTHAVSAVVGVLSLMVTQARFPEYRVSDTDILWSLTRLLWVAAYLTLLADGRRAATWLGAAALVPSVLSAAVNVAAGGVSYATTVYELLVTALPVLALAAFHRDVPAVWARPWLIALPVGVVAVMALAFVTQAPDLIVMDWAGLLCFAVTVAGMVHLVTGQGDPWSGTLLTFAVVVLGERVVTLVDYARFNASGAGMDFVVVTALGEAVVVVLVIALLVARRLARRVPVR